MELHHYRCIEPYLVALYLFHNTFPCQDIIIDNPLFHRIVGVLSDLIHLEIGNPLLVGLEIKAHSFSWLEGTRIAHCNPFLTCRDIIIKYGHLTTEYSLCRLSQPDKCPLVGTSSLDDCLRTFSAKNNSASADSQACRHIVGTGLKEDSARSRHVIKCILYQCRGVRSV